MFFYTQHFFVRGIYLGQAGRKQQRENPLYHPRGVAFFCPECCELWAACPIEGQISHAVHVECDKHEAKSVFSAPGSMWLSWDYDYLRDLPDFILRREFELLMKLYEGGLL